MPTVYVTVPPADAERLASQLVEERLAACVNRVPCSSVYRWEGEIEHDDEEILLAKTTDDAFDGLVERIEELHPYEVPCIERFEESAILPAFEGWLAECVDPPSG